jgi:hypothetical protein
MKAGFFLSRLALFYLIPTRQGHHYLAGKTVEDLKVPPGWSENFMWRPRSMADPRFNPVADLRAKDDCRVFSLPEDHVLVPHLGGGFGAGLRVWPHTVLAARMVARPVRLVLTRPSILLRRTALCGLRKVAASEMHMTEGKESVDSQPCRISCFSAVQSLEVVMLRASALDQPVPVFAGELGGIGARLQVRRAIGIPLHRDGRHGDDWEFGKPLLLGVELRTSLKPLMSWALWILGHTHRLTFVTMRPFFTPCAVNRR